MHSTRPKPQLMAPLLRRACSLSGTLSSKLRATVKTPATSKAKEAAKEQAVVWLEKYGDDWARGVFPVRMKKSAVCASFFAGLMQSLSFMAFAVRRQPDAALCFLTRIIAECILLARQPYSERIPRVPG